MPAGRQRNPRTTPVQDAPQWRAGLYARRTAGVDGERQQHPPAAMEGGPLCPPDAVDLKAFKIWSK